LALRAYQQAWMFGAHFVYGNPATSLGADADLQVMGLQDGSEVRSRAVVIATGVSYRRLGVPDLESLVGAGVFYGAATVEAQAMAGKQAFVVGGGNSAGQAALHLAKYAQQVTILVRSPSLAASMSNYLIREIGSAPNIEVRYRAEVAGGGGDGRLERLELRDQRSGKVEFVPAVGLFVLIGAEPFTNWLPEAVGRDRWGFILTGPDIEQGWPLERDPYPFETSMPGVFAAGDARHGSVKRVASAVGEGSVTIRQLHDYLARRQHSGTGHEYLRAGRSRAGGRSRRKPRAETPPPSTARRQVQANCTSVGCCHRTGPSLTSNAIDHATQDACLGALGGCLRSASKVMLASEQIAAYPAVAATRPLAEWSFPAVGAGLTRPPPS
jgi:thioredoxin reductase (NADPH)